MRWIDTTIAWLFPRVLFEGTPWGALWREKERESFLIIARIFFPLAGAVHLAHIFFYDIPNHLQPASGWLWFRILLASGTAVTFLFYMSPLVRIRLIRGPAVLMAWILCQAQAYVAVIHSMEAWVFCYVVAVACVLMLRMSVLRSLVFLSLTLATQGVVLLNGGAAPALVSTGSIVSIGITIFTRSSYLADAKSFLLNQENMEAQKKIIELNIEFADRIRSFIPRVIARRIDECMANQGMSVLEASVEVLMPRKKHVACLFSDIRGYTEGSRDLNAFVRESVIPEVKACTDIVEELGGIPRKVGDLIFAYFDETDVRKNLISCVAAGLGISRLNRDMNATINFKQIKRYVLISCGEAIVGNLGGLDSSIEITALGSPVNYLSRVDELTKHSAVARELTPGDLILCERSSALIAELAPNVVQRPICLRTARVHIRDFDNVEYIYAVSPTDANYSNLLSALDDRGQTRGRGGRTARSAA
ncbi:MAG: hypothetical protein R3E86_12530 [Pseudomonadales bacterium]